MSVSSKFDKAACSTLRQNRPKWNVIEGDINSFDATEFTGADIVSAGLPCPPFSIAGKQLGSSDERNLFPSLIRIVDQVRPRAVMVENVRGILDAVFEDYRKHVAQQLRKLGYQPGWHLMSASEFGVPQLRPRVVFVAVRKEHADHFSWPDAATVKFSLLCSVLRCVQRLIGLLIVGPEPHHLKSLREAPDLRLCEGLAVGV